MRHFLYPVSALILLSACGMAGGKTIQASGVKGDRNFALTGFDKVSLKGSDNVVVHVGGAESVHAEGDTAVLDQLDIDVQDSTLRIRRKQGFSINGGDATITVTLPRLNGVSVAGSGDMNVDRPQTDNFSASVAGSATLEIAALTAESTTVEVAGSGDVKVAGTSRRTEISIAGSGTVDAGALKGEDARISIAGSGDVKSGADGTADISIKGSGDVDIVGKARCTVSKAGSGNVNCG